MRQPPPPDIREGSEDASPIARALRGKKKLCAKCRKGKKKCGGCGCGSKMDSLHPLEYIEACELGIQHRSNAYIRSRLTADSVREDRKCGKTGIRQGAKCSKPIDQSRDPKAWEIGLGMAGIGVLGFTAARDHNNHNRMISKLNAKDKQRSARYKKAAQAATARANAATTSPRLPRLGPRR